MMLPISHGGFSGTLAVDGKVYIGDMSLRKYVPKNIEPNKQQR